MKTRVIDKATIHNCDCMDFLQACDDDQFELAIVDPPYFDGPNKSGYYGKGYSSLGIPRQAHAGGTAQWSVPTPDYFKELKRVSKNQIIWGANHFAGVFDSSGSCWIVWDKQNGGSSFADAELAYTSFKGSVRIFTYMWNGMHQGQLGGNKRNNEKRIHPTQKPVCLYEWLLTKYAKHGERILDTHMGSGSIAIATNKHGFELTACELDKEYFEKACGRIEKASRQIEMFTPLEDEKPVQGELL